MNGEEAYKPSKKEMDGAAGMMSDEQKVASNHRDSRGWRDSEGMKDQRDSFANKITEALNFYSHSIDQSLGSGENYGAPLPPELITDLEEAKRIQLEIKEKLNELKRLKFQPPM